MRVLVINCGSSSLKYELFDMDADTSLASGVCERLGSESSNIEQKSDNGREYAAEVEMPDHSVAFEQAVEALTGDEAGVIEALEEINAVGHRVVHGGEKFASSIVIDDEVEDAIDSFGALAPLHNPPNLMGIRAARSVLPQAPHVAVFDTAFHQTMPRHAYVYGLPWEMYSEHGIRRYGFHGTSHRYVSLRAAEYLRDHGIPNEDHRIVTAHLGNGCSMTAVDAGRSIDNTLGFTPLEGLLMGTRCGDLDPAIVIHLAQNLDLSLDEIDELLNTESGLKGLSGISNDMRDLQAAAADGNDRARLTMEIFAYRVRKYIGAYAAAMGGINCVVFTGGIGENDHLQRRWCVRALEFLGIVEDPEKNVHPLPFDEGLISIGADDAPTHLLVIRTNEELMIARDTVEVLSSQ